MTKQELRDRQGKLIGKIEATEVRGLFVTHKADFSARLMVSKQEMRKADS